MLPILNAGSMTQTRCAGEHEVRRRPHDARHADGRGDRSLRACAGGDAGGERWTASGMQGDGPGPSAPRRGEKPVDRPRILIIGDGSARVHAVRASLRVTRQGRRHIAPPDRPPPARAADARGGHRRTGTRPALPLPGHRAAGHAAAALPGEPQIAGLRRRRAEWTAPAGGRSSTAIRPATPPGGQGEQAAADTGAVKALIGHRLVRSCWSWAAGGWKDSPACPRARSASSAPRMPHAACQVLIVRPDTTSDDDTTNRA